ncbi:MAG: hypothetical protein RLZZ598_1532 [Pseudomonadota bacterium]|jgi:uncharacterized membrane protein YccF (DUF307 family)
MSTLLNLLWLIFGGLLMGLSWWLVGLLAFITIVGIPWGRACFVIGQFAFLPFGHTAIDREELSGRRDIGTGAFGTLGNVLWFLFAGLWLAIGHVLAAIGSALTIIGIPFALQHLKLAAIAIAPIGKTIVSNEVAAAARMRAAQTEVQRRRASP